MSPKTVRQQLPLLDWAKNLPLAWKFILTLVLVIALTAGAVISVVNVTLIKSLMLEHDFKEAAIAKSVASNSIDPFFLDNYDQIRLLLKNTKESEKDIVYAFIKTPQDTLIAHAFEKGFPEDLRRINCRIGDNGFGQTVMITEQGLLHDMCVPILHGEIGYVHLGFSQKGIKQSVSAVHRQILFIAIGITALAMIIAYFSSKIITGPLAKLQKMSQKISQGDLDYRIEVNIHDEIGKVSTTFNEMADQLKSDIRRREKMQQTILAREAQYRSLIENIQLGVALIDPDLTVKMINSALAKIIGRTTDDINIIGNRCYQEFERRDAACPDCPGIRAMENGSSHEVIREFADENGNPVFIRISAFPVVIDNGNVAGFIELVEDITERRKLEEEIHKAKKVEAVGILAGGIAHDFNNLLTGILGNISLARYNIDDRQKLHKWLAETEKAASRAKDLTQQLLTFSKGGAPVLAPTDIKNLTMETTDFILSGTDIVCEYSFPEDLYPVEADSGQISQVIQNIVINAKQAMPTGGRISIAASNSDIGEHQLHSLAAGRYIKLTISDNGPGIPAKYLDKIFDPYFSTKEGGSGLGLSISHSIIHKHGGLLLAESAPGQGTAFIIYLHAASQRPVSQQETASDVSHEASILLMDDESFVQEVAAAMLQQLGYKVATANDGQEALDLYMKAKESGQAYDVVIMDLTIPGGMGGKETIQKLKEYDPDAVAVVSSGYSIDPVMNEYMQYGFSGVIEKPYVLQTLSQSLHKILEQSHRGRT